MNSLPTICRQVPEDAGWTENVNLGIWNEAESEAAMVERILLVGRPWL